MGCFQSKEEYEPPQATRAAREAGIKQDAAKVAAAPASIPVPAAIPRAKVEITDADRAKHKLKHTRDVLDRTITNSETVLIRDLSLAKSLHMEGKKESALVLLRRRKLIEKRITVTKVQLEKIENSLSTLEGAENMNIILNSIEQSTKVIEKLNTLVTVERAEKVMEDSRDAVAYTAEVAAVLVQDNEAQETEDEDDIMAQIREFEQEEGKEDEVLNTTPEPEDEPEEKVEQVTQSIPANEISPSPKDTMVEESEEAEEEEEEEVVEVKKKKKKPARTPAMA